jgi:LL-diaminopimelate aminotransferase
MGTIMGGGEIYMMPLDADDNFRPRLDQIRGDLSRAELLWVNYPNNPTGAVIGLDVYEELVTFCRERRILLCSDNPYAEVVFDGYRAPSALQVPGAKDCTVEFMSLSKTYNMAGWRLGACVGNREALDNLLTIKSNMDSGHFKAVYDAGSVALNETPDLWLDQRNAVYQARRDKIAAALPHIGLRATSPKASLYFWAKVDHGDDQRYVDGALEDALVALTPGTMYGTAGRGFVRLSLGIADQRLDEALDRLKSWYTKNG